MTGRVEGKVAFITGRARGQGRSHAITLAREGADIIAVDLLRADRLGALPDGHPPGGPGPDGSRRVEAAGRRIVATVADVRDYDALKQALDDGVAQFGPAGHRVRQRRNRQLRDARRTSGADLAGHDRCQPDRGEWPRRQAAIPHLRAGGRGGSMILTSSELG